jgi:integrase
VTFAYKSGWRSTEIKLLTWSRVDLKLGTVRLEAGETKNDEARTFYLDGELKDIFQLQWEARKSLAEITAYVFPNKAGNNRIADFRRSWARACEAAGIGPPDIP